MNRDQSPSELISNKEKKDILASLENEFFGNADNETGRISFASKKRGLLLQLLITTLSIAATVAVLLISPMIRLDRNKGNSLGSPIREGSDNRIFSTYREETERTISDKTKQIAVYEEKILDYDSKLLYLKNLINRNSGQSDQSVTEMLPQYRDMSDEEIEAEISKLESERETVSREIENAKKEIMEAEADDPFSEVARYQQIQNQEALVTDQISLFYNRILEDLDSMRFDDARDNLQSLSGLIESDMNSFLPSIEKRKPIDRRIISFLDTHIKTLVNRVDEDNTSEELSSKAELYVLNGDNLAELGETGEAEQFYRESLKLIPFMGRAHDQLEYFSNERWQRKVDELIREKELLSDQQSDEEEQPVGLSAPLIADEADGGEADNAEQESADDNSESGTLADWDNQDLFGVVATYESPGITIESFHSGKPEPGMNLTIRRFDSTGRQEIIAAGKIVSSGTDIIAGVIESLFGEGILLPAQDLVYLDMEETD